MAAVVGILLAAIGAAAMTWVALGPWTPPAPAPAPAPRRRPLDDVVLTRDDATGDWYLCVVAGQDTVVERLPYVGP